jgi:hypothetical protein
VILTVHDFTDRHLRWRGSFTEIGTHHVDLEVREAGGDGDGAWLGDTVVAVFSVKWDSCAHIGFRDDGLGRNWTHVCGAEDMESVLRMLQWGWNLCAQKLAEMGYDDEVREIDVVLDGD